MLFYGFLLVVGFALVWWFIRSPMFRQLRRGHGTARAPFSSANDHGLDHSGHMPGIDPTGQPRARDWE